MIIRFARGSINYFFKKVSATMKKFFQSFFRGLGSVVDIYPDNNRIKKIHPYQSDIEALRRDVERIGKDMWKVIDKNYGKYTCSSSSGF
jgi:hypothetical protein